jgi:prevent-host-death family protein
LSLASRVKASEFKAKCLALIDEVAATGESVIVTKHGKPIAELVPDRSAQKSPFGIWKGKVEITGDIISPLDVEWDAMK